MGCHKKSVLWELSASLCSRAACIKGLTLPFSHTDAHTRNSAQCKTVQSANSGLQITVLSSKVLENWQVV